MIQASYRNFNAYANNRSSYSSRQSRRSSPSNSNFKISLSSSNDFTYKETNMHQWASSRARSSNDWCRKTSPISRKKWPEEAFRLRQHSRPCTTSLPRDGTRQRGKTKATETPGRSKKEERRKRTSTKSIETTSRKTSPKEYQRIMHSSRNQ